MKYTHLTQEQRYHISAYKVADKANAAHVLLIGENELSDGTVWHKTLKTQEERTVLVESLTTT